MFKKHRLAVFIGILNCILSFAQAVEIDSSHVLNRDSLNGFTTPSRMIADLEFISRTIQDHYALSEWKQELFGWNLLQELEEARHKILTGSDLTIKKYQQILKTFLNSTRDYHVEVLFYSTEMAMLPFNIERVGDRYFISSIDEEYKKRAPSLFNVGDELVLFDDLPIAEAVSRFLSAGNQGGNEASDLALAQTYLTCRYAFYGHEVPQGRVKLATRCACHTDLIWHEMQWDYFPEEVEDPQAQPKWMRAQVKHEGLKQHPYFEKLALLPGYELTHNKTLTQAIGDKQSVLPPLGRIKWKIREDSLFQAYIFEHRGMDIGFIRLPTYYVDDYETAVKNFSHIIKKLKNTECLIIDQMSNPGGNLLYLYALVSMLSDKPLILPKHRITLTQQDVYFALLEAPELAAVRSDADAKELLGKTLQGIPVTCDIAQGIARHLKFIIEEWNAGKRLTGPANLLGIGPIPPYPKIRYSKPILVLTNRLDFSGGDFFPAILQDNQRALIMGTPTAGAGGYLHKVTFPNLNGISSFSYTVSLAERINGQPIENLGVTPDIFYEISEMDLHTGYGEYSREILKVVDKLCEETLNDRQNYWKYPLSKKLW